MMDALGLALGACLFWYFDEILELIDKSWQSYLERKYPREPKT